jgi:hypothetical protein
MPTAPATLNPHSAKAAGLVLRSPPKAGVSKDADTGAVAFTLRGAVLRTAPQGEE